MSIKLKTPSNGSVTLSPQDTASDVTVTVPASTGEMTTTTSTQTLTNKTLTNPTINGFTGNTSVINIGSGQIYKDASGNVGIGTSSPGNRLEVYNLADTQIRVSNGTAAQSYDFGRNGSTGLFTFYGNQTGFTGYVFSGVDGERLRINSSGNVGIGTSSPSYRLDVDTTASSIVGAFRSSSTETYVLLKDTNTTLGHVRLGSSSGAMLFRAGNAERARIDSNGDFSAWCVNAMKPEYKCRAWVNFNGTTSPGTIRASGNVSSVTRHAVGDYSVNFSTAMPDANYSKIVTVSFIYGTAHSIVNTDASGNAAEAAPTTSAFRFLTSSNISGLADVKYASVAIFR